MKKSHLLTAATLVGLPVIALQYFQNAKLKTEITNLNTIVLAQRESTAPAPRALEDASKKKAASSQTSALSLTNALAIELAESGDLKTILAHRDPLVRMSALMTYVGKLSDAELPDALTTLRQNTPDWDPDARVAAQLILTRWGAADPDGAFTYIDKLDLKKAGGDAATVLSALAATDPQRAIKWLEDPDNKYVNMPWMGQILAGSVTKEWVRQDPDAALKWALSVPENQRTGAFTGVLGSIAATDPVRASSLAMELPDGDARREILGQIAKAWSETDPAAALDWANSLSGDEKKKAMGETLGTWAQSDPRQAALYVDKLPEDQRDAKLIDQVAGTWARQEPAEAARWIGQMPENEGKIDAMGDVIWNWTVADPAAASEWLLQQEPGRSRDEGIGALAKATFDNDPESAVTWAAHMSDEKRRVDSVGIGIHFWLERDPQAASKWLENTNALTDAEVNTIISAREQKK
jgi:hypothetical protein